VLLGEKDSPAYLPLRFNKRGKRSGPSYPKLPAGGGKSMAHICAESLGNKNNQLNFNLIKKKNVAE